MQVRTAAALDEGLRDVLIPETQEVTFFILLKKFKHNVANRQVVFDENNGALVLISGKLDIQDSLKDEKYVKATKKPS